MKLAKNNITDDSGIQSIIDGLKTNKTLQYLDLRINQLSETIRLQLGAINHYKRNGLNGYPQVDGMEIKT